MNSEDKRTSRHSVKKEPKFCRWRVCHEYFYADTIAEANLVLYPGNNYGFSELESG